MTDQRHPDGGDTIDDEVDELLNYIDGYYYPPAYELAQSISRRLVAADRATTCPNCGGEGIETVDTDGAGSFNIPCSKCATPNETTDAEGDDEPGYRADGGELMAQESKTCPDCGFKFTRDDEEPYSTKCPNCGSEVDEDTYKGENQPLSEQAWDITKWDFM